MLIATVLITLGALGRRARNGRRPRGGESIRSRDRAAGFAGWRGVSVAASAAVVSFAGVATAAVVCS
ncbi:hypothetical protein [Nocardia sp. NBC_01329]|uniref:hypothetical protein n=1 Tax=Nocardia sp. NBC_01329 TaxID=2903594 RepID=UPI002E155027|nr:hypothetical protein OG405_07720 [Nocardia sp. NBC_01329]